MAVSRPKSEKSRLDLPEIKKLIEMLERSPIVEFEFVDKDLRIRISKNGTAHAPVSAPVSLPVLPQALSPAASSPPAPSETPPIALPKRAELFEVKSPMVGTFYRAPAPDAEAYVRIGDIVEPGKVICIVEAMKLMNEIESEVRGRIVEICVENAQPVEFGQLLFRIDTSVS